MWDNKEKIFASGVTCMNNKEKSFVAQATFTNNKKGYLDTSDKSLILYGFELTGD